MLEVRVHLDLTAELLPAEYLLLGIDLGELPVEEVADVPAGPAAFGDVWLAEERTPLLKVPSVIVPERPNLLLNPSHPDAVTLRILRRRLFAFDRRLWLPLWARKPGPLPAREVSEI